jgi:REP-associated tyrosine transposase
VGRPPRPTAPGIYHVGTKAPTALPFFHDAEDYYVFMATLSRVILFEHLTCLAFCLMTTHYHLLLDAPEGALPRAMKQLNWHYARSVNERLGGRGHVVGGRYFSVPVSETDHLLNEFKYIALNPVEAGLCKAPQEWRWSSYAGTVGLEREFGFIDSSLIFGSIDGGEIGLRAFVEGV